MSRTATLRKMANIGNAVNLAIVRCDERSETRVLIVNGRPVPHRLY